MTVKLSIFFILIFAIIVTGCIGTSYLSSLKDTDDLFIYEGLPHPLREHAAFKKEKKRKDIKEILGHWFYSSKTKISGQSRKRLMSLLDKSGFKDKTPFEPETDCGPFHPDLAVMWEADDEENYLMICFTCNEAALIIKEKTKKYSLNGTKKDWEEMFSFFQKNRDTKP
ncbi:MAG: hypothetical protein QNL93_06405 [Opitutae bacterium]